jgi:hypothetical protein
MIDEMCYAFEDEIQFPENNTGDSWVSVNINEALMKIICRISNRTFVGLPLCRDKDYVDVNIKYTMDVVLGSQVVRMCPSFLRG